MSDFAPGDLVVCVQGGVIYPMGAVRRVSGICSDAHDDDRFDGLLFADAPPPVDNECECFHPRDWRKIDKADDGFSEWVKTMRPAPVRETEDATMRLNDEHRARFDRKDGLAA